LPILSIRRESRDSQQNAWHPECYEAAHRYWNVRFKGCVPIKRIGGAWCDLDDQEIDGNELKIRLDATLATISAMMRMMSTFHTRFEQFIFRILRYASRGDYEASTLNTSLLVSAVGSLCVALDHALETQSHTSLTGQYSSTTQNNTMADNGLAIAHEESPKGISEECIVAHEDLTKGMFEECIGLLKAMKKFPLAPEMGTQESQAVLILRARKCTKRITHSLLQLIGLSLEIATFEHESFPYYFSTTCMTTDLMIHRQPGMMASLLIEGVDTCAACGLTVDGRCFKENARLWHAKCLQCTRCHQAAAFFDDATSDRLALLRNCRFCEEGRRAYPVTASLQRRQLLWVELARVMSARRIGWDALSQMSIGE
jgi:hypothetical protein